jgi:hypothetical protein
MTFKLYQPKLHPKPKMPRWAGALRAAIRYAREKSCAYTVWVDNNYSPSRDYYPGGVCAGNAKKQGYDQLVCIVLSDGKTIESNESGLYDDEYNPFGGE